MRGRTPRSPASNLPASSSPASPPTADWSSLSHGSLAGRSAKRTWTAESPLRAAARRRDAAVESAANLRHLARVEQLASLMDEAYRIPGTSYRIGLDGIVGLLPVVGDAVSLGTNAYVIYVAERLGVSRWTLARMMLNAGFDFAVGSVPLVGDLFDVAFKSHLRNLTLLRRSLGRQDSAT